MHLSCTLLLGLVLLNDADTSSDKLQTTQIITSLPNSNSKLKLERTAKILCLDYDALADFSEFDEKYESRLFRVEFFGCFNNATDHWNYQHFVLQDAINKMVNESSTTHGIVIHFHEYGFVDASTFFGNFMFTKYESIDIVNVDFNSSEILPQINGYIQRFKTQNGSPVDFNEFTVNSLTLLELRGNNILHFTKNNLAKFHDLEQLVFQDFLLADSNALTVANLFELNKNLFLLKFENSYTKITLHEDVFRGLHHLSSISLNKLRLETMPPKLFYDLPQLHDIELKYNDIKRLDASSFINNLKLYSISFGNEMFLYSEETQHLQLVSDRVTISIFDVPNVEFELLSPLLQNPYIKQIHFRKCNLINLDLMEFTKPQNRSSKMFVKFNYEPLQIPIKELRQQASSFGTLASLSTEQYQSNTEMMMDFNTNWIQCPEIVFNSDIFLLYLEYRESNFYIYFKEASLMINLYLPSALEATYFFPYKENCPELCACKHNSLLDEIIIDCHNRSLSSVPTISYPTQFDVIDSISLDLSNNLFVDITFENQDIRIMQKLISLEIGHNPLENVIVPAERLTKTVLCIDRIYQRQRGTSVNISGNVVRARNVCKLIGPRTKGTFQYVRQKSNQVIVNIIDSYRYNETCPLFNKTYS